MLGNLGFECFKQKFISSLDVFNPIDGAGQIIEEIVIPEAGIKDGAIGEWKVNIHCGDCGDQEPRFSPGDFRDIADTGNDWRLSYYYEFHTNN